MAAATKIAAFGALLRVLYVAVPGLSDEWRPILWAVAIATMLVGAVLAVTQTDVKRMLAYSAISHTGFVLTGVVAANEQGISSTLFYLVVYGIGTVGVFAVVTLIRDPDGEAGTCRAGREWDVVHRCSAACSHCSCCRWRGSHSPAVSSQS